MCVSASCLFESFPNFSVEALVLGPFIFKSFMSGDVRPLAAVSVVNVFSVGVLSSDAVSGAFWCEDTFGFVSLEFCCLRVVSGAGEPWPHTTV